MNVPATLTNATLGDNNFQGEQGQHQAAPFYAKRLVLKLQLAQQVKANEKEKIDTSVIVHDLTDNKLVYEHNIDYAHYAASISKLFVTSVLLDQLRAGNASLDTVVNWDASDRRAGAGKYDADGSPTSATVRDVLIDMLNRSGNTAVRVIVNKTLGGAAAVNAYYQAHYPQLAVTRLQPIDANRFLLGYTTPAETDFILDRIYSSNDSFADEVKHALGHNIFNDYGPRSQVLDHELINVIDKQGQLNDPEGNNRHDVGVIENVENGHKLRYVLMTTNFEQPAGQVTNDATASLQEFGRDMLRFEGDRKPQKQQSVEQMTEQQKATEVENGRLVY